MPTWNKGNGIAIRWVREHVSYQGDDCLRWPFSYDRRVGRGRLGFEGKPLWAHRIMCELAHGAPPTPKHQTAHSCGNGHEGCVNPRHLAWKTNSENQFDRWRNGDTKTNRYGNRGQFTPGQIKRIRSLKGKKTQMQIASMFGVSLGCIQYYHKYREQRGHEPS